MYRRINEFKKYDHYRSDLEKYQIGEVLSDFHNTLKKKLSP
jgi:hypothetical protein